MKEYKLGVVLIFMLVLTGCMSQVVHSRKSTDFNEQIDKLDVLFIKNKKFLIQIRHRKGSSVSNDIKETARKQLAMFSSRLNNDLESRLMAELKKNKVNVLDFKTVAMITRKIRDDRKENRLMISYSGEVLCKHFICHHSLVVRASLFTPEKRQSVWSSSFKLSYMEDSNSGNEVKSFVDNLISQMKKDNLLVLSK